MLYDCEWDKLKYRPDTERHVLEIYTVSHGYITRIKHPIKFLCEIDWLELS